MEYSFWLPQDYWDWENIIPKACQVFLDQLPLDTLEKDLEEGFPVNEDEKTQQEWVYEYMMAHKLV